jgi:hypothetical protein
MTYQEIYLMAVQYELTDVELAVLSGLLSDPTGNLWEALKFVRGQWPDVFGALNNLVMHRIIDVETDGNGFSYRFLP